jgi:hypothetical protein
MNAERTSQKGRVLIGNLEHDKLARFDLMSNRWAVDLKKEIKRFDSLIFYNHSMGL